MKNLCEAHKIKASQILHKKISTHLVIMLILFVMISVSKKDRTGELEDREEEFLRKQNNPWHRGEIRGVFFLYVVSLMENRSMILEQGFRGYRENEAYLYIFQERETVNYSVSVDSIV